MKKTFWRRAPLFNGIRRLSPLHIPGGVTSPATLRKIADVAENSAAQVLKITSAQRIAIVGLAEDKLTRYGKLWVKNLDTLSAGCACAQ
ncbi:MAG: hypothetical protein R2864_14240 [Syntrophotaleaceae bacterium]